LDRTRKFAMPDSSRLFLCRAGFVLFCVVPTALVGLWIVRRSTGDYALAQRAEWQRALSSRLGMAVEIDRVRYPSYATARLEGVRLLEPETRALAAQSATVEISAADQGWQIEAWQPQIAADQLEPLARLLAERLLRSAGGDIVRCTMAAHELTITSADQAQSFTQVAGRLEPASKGPQLALEFHLPMTQPASATPARLTITRNRQQSPPASHYELDTAGNSLPCGLLADLVPQFVHLGRDCRFAGTASWTLGAAASGQFAGTLEGVDLDMLVTEHFPHQLSGQARVQVEQGLVAGSKLTELRGTLHAADGAISPSLLAAAAEHLQLAPPADLNSMPPGQAISYRRLAIGFHLDGNILRLAGSADPTKAGVLVANASGPILEAPPKHAVAATNLLRVLLPESQFQVPATRQTDALVGLLPLPDPAPTRTASLPGHTPTRLAPASGGSAPPIRQPGLR
jgi:hypothetical protein